MSPTLASLYPRREIVLSTLAEEIGGKPAGPKAALDRRVTGLTTLVEADAGQVSFVSSPKFLDAARQSRAAAVIVGPGMDLGPDVAVIQVAEVWGAVIRALAIFCPPDPPRSEIHPSAVVSPEARLGRDVSVGPLSVIEAGAVVGDRVRIGAQVFVGRGAVLGEDVLLHPQVVIHAGVELGKRVICQSGAIIGGDGFKYEVIGGRLTKIPQVGTVIIEDDAEIGANTTIDRASLTETRVGARVKVDNLVQLAHNVVVGSDSLIISQVGVAGSTRIGRGCVLAGQVGIADNVVIGDGVRIGAQSGVSNAVTTPGDYLGAPAIPVREQARILMSLPRLPDLVKRVRKLEKAQGGESPEE